MPFSRSRSVESMTRSMTSEPARNAPVCHSMASTSVVFPWSTCATMATFRRSSRERVGMHPGYRTGEGVPPSPRESDGSAESHEGPDRDFLLYSHKAAGHWVEHKESKHGSPRGRRN